MANTFPRWSNLLPLKIAFCVLSVAAGVSVAFTYYATPKAQVVGYQPSQPIAFSQDPRGSGGHGLPLLPFVCGCIRSFEFTDRQYVLELPPARSARQS